MPVASGPADLLILSGSAFTAGWSSSRKAGLAIRDGVIIAVAPSDDLASLRGPATQVLELEKNSLVLPGFQDVHVHPITAGLTLSSIYLSELRGAEAVGKAIADHVAAHPDHQWVRGWGWYQEDFPPHGLDTSFLDRLIPDRPAYITRSDGHAAAVNSVALRIAGISAATPDPAGGRIERDASGQPTGLLHEWAMGLVQQHLPDTTAAELGRALDVGQSHLLSLGITSWQDASVDQDVQRAYTDAATSGRLVARVTGALRWDGSRGVEQVAELVERRDQSGSDRFVPTRVKIMQDGVVEGSLTASVLSPYFDPASGEPTRGTGTSFHAPEELNAAVAALSGAGFGLHFHVIGDRAVREALDAVELAAIAHGPAQLAPVLSHIQLIDPTDIERFAHLGAVASMQPLWASRDTVQTDLTIPYLGQERSARQYPFRALADTGAVLAGGSDWMVSSADPIAAIHTAVNRSHFGSLAEPLFAANALTVTEAVTAYTAGTALASGNQFRSGRLVPGADADLVVLDADLFAGPADQIGGAQVVTTIIGGKTVYQRG